ncbi:MAG: hypothetical protein ACREID_04100 [Planctomycetota bacterium]
MKPNAPIPLLLALILPGCENEFGSDEAAALAGSAIDAPGQPGTVAPPVAPPEEPAPIAEEMFVTAVDHTYFPLTPGTARVYEGVDEGLPRRDEVRVGAEPHVVSGIACTAVTQEVFLDGRLAELTTEWFAQDRDGNVWKFGEETLEFDGVRLAPTADSWEAGVDGARPWVALAADPKVGDVYVGYRPGGQDTLSVVSLTETATVPAGVFENCLQAVENAEDPDDADIILYAPGTGLVSETSAGGRIDLVSIHSDE